MKKPKYLEVAFIFIYKITNKTDLDRGYSGWFVCLKPTFFILRTMSKHVYVHTRGEEGPGGQPPTTICLSVWQRHVTAYSRLISMSKHVFMITYLIEFISECWNK